MWIRVPVLVMQRSADAHVAVQSGDHLRLQFRREVARNFAASNRGEDRESRLVMQIDHFECANHVAVRDDVWTDGGIHARSEALIQATSKMAIAHDKFRDMTLSRR